MTEPSGESPPQPNLSPTTGEDSLSLPPTDGHPLVPPPASVQPPSVPQVQYFQPSGHYLPQPSWRRSSHRWVWIVSTGAAVLLAGGAITALVVGSLQQLQFTATGALPVDCHTRQALDGAPVGAGTQVQIFEADSGDLLATSALTATKDLKGGGGACFQTFRAADVDVVSGGYLVKLGDRAPQYSSREALEGGLLLD